MTCDILFEKVEDSELPSGLYQAYIPALGLTTHGENIEGARIAAIDLVTLWLDDEQSVRNLQLAATR